MTTNPTDDQKLLGKLIAWREPNRECKMIAKVAGVDCKPSLKHRRGRYVLVRIGGKDRYLDLDSTAIEVIA